MTVIYGGTVGGVCVLLHLKCVSESAARWFSDQEPAAEVTIYT